MGGALPRGGLSELPQARDRRVVLPEAMTRYRCNQKACCCQGWLIHFTVDDIGRLASHLPEDERAARLEGITIISEDTLDKPGEVPHVRLDPVSADGKCRFVEGTGGCEVHRRFGPAALPGLCVNFPVVPIARGPNPMEQEVPVELHFDLVCPSVLDQIAESDAPYRMVEGISSDIEVAAPRVEFVAGHPNVSLNGTVPATFEQLDALRMRIMEACNTHPGTIFELLADISYALGKAATSGDLDAFRVVPVANRDEFNTFLGKTINAHDPAALARNFMTYQRFVFDVELPVLDLRARLTKVYAEWHQSYDERVGPFLPQSLLRRYLAHRYVALFASAARRLHFSYGSVVHAFALALRTMAALCLLTDRKQVDLPIAKASIGAAEYFYRSFLLAMPEGSMPWFVPAEPPAPT